MWLFCPLIKIRKGYVYITCDHEINSSFAVNMHESEGVSLSIYNERHKRDFACSENGKTREE